MLMLIEVPPCRPLSKQFKRVCCAPVAQMDRALASGAKGRGFESLLARHLFPGPTRRHGLHNVPPTRVAIPSLMAGGPAASAKDGFVGAPRVGVTRGSSLSVVLSRLSGPRDQWSPIRAPLSHKKESYSISTRRNSAPVRDSRDSRACTRVSLVSCACCKH